MANYWIAASAILFLAMVALAISFLMRHKRGWSHSIVVHLAFIAAMFGLIITCRQVAHMLLDDYKVTYITAGMINTTSVLLMALIAMQQLFQLINRLTHSQISHNNDPTTTRMVARVLKVVIFLVIVLLFGEHFGIGLSGLLAFGGIGGIAIGVAGKDILSNLFSGVMLYFDRPFSLGDWIRSPDRNIEGTVVEIGWRMTKITTFDHRPLYVPNSLFSTISVENPGRMTNRRIDTTIGLRYEDAGKIGQIIDDIRLMLKNNDQIDQTQTTLVYFNAFADSSLNIMVYTFTKTTVWAEWLAIQQDVYLKIIEIVQAHSADFAYPTETLYMTDNKADSSPVMPHDINNAVRSAG